MFRQIPPRKFIHLQVKRRKTKSTNNGNGELPAPVREQMKKAFAECHRAVLAWEDETGRKRCELFRELPDILVGASLKCSLCFAHEQIKTIPTFIS